MVWVGLGCLSWLFGQLFGFQILWCFGVWFIPGLCAFQVLMISDCFFFDLRFVLRFVVTWVLSFSVGLV